MDINDKITFAVAVSGAALAAAKLIADKESKTSEFRQEWTRTFRAALCECLASAHVIAGRVKIRRDHRLPDGLTRADRSELETALTPHWVSFRSSYQMVLLHLNYSETCSAPMAPQNSGLGNDCPAYLSGTWNQVRDQDSMNFARRIFLPRKDAYIDKPSNPSPAAKALVREIRNVAISLESIYTQLASESRASAKPGSSSICRCDAAMNKHEEIACRQFAEVVQHIEQATLFGNLTLKPEWNRIKQGEKLYRAAVWAAAGVVTIGVWQLTVDYLISRW